MNLLSKFFGDAKKCPAITWAFNDFANSAYSVLILSFVFPIFYKEVIAGEEMGDFYWGLIMSISILVSGLLSPVIGAIADIDSGKKQKFLICTLLSIIFTALLYFTSGTTLLLSSIIFIIANTTFGLAATLNDSYLASVSTKSTVGRISGLAWGMGYLGGVVALLVLQPLFKNGYAGEMEHLYKLTFPMTALFYLIFSIPFFVYLRNEKIQKSAISTLKLIKVGFTNVKNTIRNIKSNKNVARYLLGYYFLNDGLVTVFSFTLIYARTTFGLSMEDLIKLLLLLQVIALPVCTIFGYISDKIPPKKILLLTILTWIIIIALLAMAQTLTMLYVCLFLISLIIGPSQSVARSWFCNIIPAGKNGEFFGFNGFASKISATTGPIIFGAISVISGNQRIALVALIPFFVIAFVILLRVEEEE